MRLGIISPYVTSDFVGESYYNVQAFGLSRELAKKGVDVDILTCRKKGDPRERTLEATDGQVTIKYLEPNLQIPRVSMMNPAAVLANINQNDYDCIQLSEDSNLTSWYIGFLRRFIPSRIVVYQGVYKVPGTARGQLYYRMMDGLVRKRMTESVDTVIAKTRAAESFMVSRGYRDIRTIPVGIDTERFHQLPRGECRSRFGFAEDETILLYVGIIEPYRDIETSIRATAKLSERGERVRLVIVGNGSDMERLQILAADLGIANRVTWIGSTKNRLLPGFYSAANLTLLPMRRRTLFIFGMVIPESLSCGTPVISAPVPAALDHIKDGYNGAIVDFEDPTALAEAISRALSSDNDWRRMSRNSRDYCRTHLDWKVLVEKYVESYRG